MLDLLKVATENALASTLIASVLIGAASLAIQQFRHWQHKRFVIAFLQSSAHEGRYQFRSTEAIAAATKLTEARVEEICSAHNQILRNSAQKQSWRITNE